MLARLEAESDQQQSSSNRPPKYIHKKDHKGATNQSNQEGKLCSRFNCS